MKYLILIYGNAATRGLWEEMSQEQRAAAAGGYVELNRRLDESGEKVTSAALAFPTEGKRIEVRDGKTMATDGPFAEVKEFLAGFYLVDCADFDSAVEYASLLPEAGFGFVEVRPTVDLSGIGI
ncbi:YciI family protein [Amycolatopsis sp. CA-230715]|uniref:YciI family protein n=1 Tax=Amycolatopsis sp. CA-230715 TaxID=2745196 RepID=UPI001C01C4E2|nr:YciI family protein [Amycolatopsis sp. CA-230715]QWF85049.1 hypothetical protein HUW46_08502 [Amycolatopsis sp. CA-230715]